MESPYAMGFPSDRRVKMGVLIGLHLEAMHTHTHIKNVGDISCSAQGQQ